jgi:hypothetical protein
VKTGVHPPFTWIPFFNGMTATAGRPDAGLPRQDGTVTKRSPNPLPSLSIFNCPFSIAYLPSIA